MDNNGLQISQLDRVKIIEIISKIPSLTDDDKQELFKRVASNDVDLDRIIQEKIDSSKIAGADLILLTERLSEMSKKGMYVKSKQTFKTGSGQFEIEMKGGDTKLIIPVLVIIGIVTITVVMILFWK